jgi:hypothetical protein
MSLLPIMGGITGVVIGVIATGLSDFAQLKNRITVAKNGMIVFILWVHQDVIYMNLKL